MTRRRSSYRSLTSLQRDNRVCRACVEAGYPLESMPVIEGLPGQRAYMLGQAPGIVEGEERRPWRGRAGRTLRTWLGRLVLLALAPAVVANIGFGQTGFVLASLMIAGLVNLDRRPVLAGIMFGLLTIKPHFGVLEGPVQFTVTITGVEVVVPFPEVPTTMMVLVFPAPTVPINRVFPLLQP